MLPVYLFADDLMKSLKKNYYLGLYSAAAIHGAGHQQPMESHGNRYKKTLKNLIV
jgi:hypothetical protein